jgi:hypothetical protein
VKECRSIGRDSRAGALNNDARLLQGETIIDRVDRIDLSRSTTVTMWRFVRAELDDLKSRSVSFLSPSDLSVCPS